MTEPRNGQQTTADALWTLDRFGRWRSPKWRDYVRQQKCGCDRRDCLLCYGPWKRDGLVESDFVVAAHFRYGPQVGAGVKPDDFLCYPLANKIHQLFHSKGQPDASWQLERVVRVLRQGFKDGVLRIEDPFFALIPF